MIYPKRLAKFQALVIICLSILLFIVMLSVVRDGVKTIAPSLNSRYTDTGLLGGLGMGWLGAMFFLNGSAVAATAVAMLSAHAIGVETAFGMIHGSRLGAGLLVLLLGVIYKLRGSDKKDALSTGIQSLLVAHTIHLPAIIGGYLLLKAWGNPEIALHLGGSGNSPLDAFINPPLNLIQDTLPDWSWLPVGFIGLIISLGLFDRAIKTLLSDMEAQVLEKLPPRLINPITLFLVGLLVTSFTMSVAISLGLLVPLVARGVIPQRFTLPYVMGAGISTFIDTFFAASLLNSSPAQGLVLTIMVWIGIVALLLLLLAYPRYEAFIENTTDKLLYNRYSLLAYLMGLFILPFAFTLISLVL